MSMNVEAARLQRASFRSEQRPKEDLIEWPKDSRRLTIASGISITIFAACARTCAQIVGAAKGGILGGKRRAKS
jgi:hypothetical protein